MKYKKKPVVIEADQLTYEKAIGREPTVIAQWMEDNPGIIEVFYTKKIRGSEYALIHTLEGVMRANSGDYIIKGIYGEFYPCKSDIFKKTYEQAEPKPLTLEELREALKNPNDWLWGEDIQGNGECSGWYKCEHLYRVSNIARYGDTWLAYRNRPEGIAE